MEMISFILYLNSILYVFKTTLKRIESNARGIGTGIELRISNRTDDDDSTTLAIILDLCMYPAGTHPSAVQPEHRSFGFLGLLP